MPKNGYVEENTEGSFRVRDKDDRDGSPVIVWGSHLTHAEAHQLKERVCGAEKSTTARIESMDLPLPATAVTPQGQPISNEPPRALPRPRADAYAPSPGGRRSSVVTPRGGLDIDPQIAAAQQKAMAAARTHAAQSQQRADNLIALPQHPQNVVADSELAQLEDLGPGDAPEIPDGIEGELDELIEDPASSL